MTRWKINPSKRQPGMLVVLGPWDEAFIAALKAGVPARLRTWDPKLRAWLVNEAARAKLEQIIEDHS